MFRKCRFCICWIWVWIYLGYWVELGNFQIWNDSHNNCHCSVLQNSTDKLCPAILYLWPFRWKFPPGKGGRQVSLSMLSYIHVFLSPSNLTSMISKESEVSQEKNQVGEKASPADLDLGLIRRRTSWGLHAWILVLCWLQVRGRHLVCFFHDKKVMKAHLKSWEGPL